MFIRIYMDTCMYTNIYIHRHICILTPSVTFPLPVKANIKHYCMYIYIFIYKFTKHTYLHICIYVYTYIHIHIEIWIYMYGCVYIYRHIYILSPSVTFPAPVKANIKHYYV
jgi:hypothetical protein